MTHIDTALIAEVRWYRRAADQGDAEAQFNLGVCYDTGQGVAMDRAKAMWWYRLAADQGHAAAQYNLGVCYDNGWLIGQGVAVDHAEAVRWYHLAAAQGGAKAQYNLGVCFYKGEGVAMDHAEAVHWFRLAAAQGYAAAQYNLGVCFYKGRGVAVDHAEADRWFRLAAGRGLAEAISARRETTCTTEEPVPKRRKEELTEVDEAEPVGGHGACVVCMVNRRRMAFADCGHLCLCLACARKITGACPMCRVPIRHNMIKIFY
ncbi:MAG: hypothetical protein M0R22_11375 [Dehalococcoidia bacterium]|jgi:hypothetical protein|nr:hypothetical protein [Dehalococcoidia bacterium]